MIIQIDSREKSRAIKKIIAEFDRQDIKHFISKLYVGDYLNMDNPRVVIDRKQNLAEICNNIIHDHQRFRTECIRAKDNGIRLIVLCEHGQGIERIEDVIWWDNPRIKKNEKATTGETLYKCMLTMARKYNVEWMFCRKEETGKKIIELLEVKE